MKENKRNKETKKCNEMKCNKSKERMFLRCTRNIDRNIKIRDSNYRGKF